MISNLFSRSLDRLRSCLNYQFPRLGGAVFRGTFKLLPSTMDVRLFPHIRAELDFSEPVQQACYWRGTRLEMPTFPILETWLVQCPGGVFFDIGSNFGFYSFYCSSKFPTLNIHAFEPNPVTHRRLKAIVDRNKLIKITPWEMGLGDETIDASLYINEDDSGQATFGAHPGFKVKNADVHLETFEQWRKQVGLEFPKKPEWIAKIDVEGYELKVLSGMKEALGRKVFRGLIVELSEFNQKFCNSSIEEIVDLLQKYGYVRLKSFQTKGKAFDLGKNMNGFFVPESLSQ